MGTSLGKGIVICRATPVAPDPRVERAATVLGEAGFAVTVVGWDRGWNLPEFGDRGVFRLIRIRVPASFGRGLRNLPALLRWQGSLLRWLARNRRDYDIIHACDLDTALPGLAAARAFGKGLVFDIFDSYAEAFRLGTFPVRWLARRLEQAIVERSDAVIIADDIRRGQLAGARPKRLEVIYNAPPDLLAHMRPEQKASELRVTYVGLLDQSRGLEFLLEVLAHRPEWRLDLAGFGVDESWVRNRSECLPNVRFHGRVDYEAALWLMAGADVLVATYDPAVPNHRYASPNKLFEAMMLTKPVVVARGTHIDGLVERFGCGLVVPYGDVEALAAALERLATDPGLCCRLGEAGRRAYEACYHWDRMRDRLVALYRELGRARVSRE